MRNDGERQLKSQQAEKVVTTREDIQKPKSQAVRTVSHLASGLEQSDIFGLWNRSPSLFASVSHLASECPEQSGSFGPRGCLGLPSQCRMVRQRSIGVRARRGRTD